MVFKDARPAHHRHAIGARRQQDSCTGIGGRAAGMDIIDQHDRLAVQPFDGPRADRKHSLDRFGPLATSKPAQRGRRTGTQQEIVRNRYAAAPFEGACDQQRLIEATRPDSPPMQRHWHHQIRIVRQQSRHLPSHRLGINQAPAVFQPQSDSPRDIAVSHRRTNTGMGWALPLAIDA